MYKPIDSNSNRLHGWARPEGFQFAATDAVVPLLMAEASHALATFPLAFHADSSGAYSLVALQSVSAGCNLFLDANGRCIAAYIPCHYRAYPFALLQAQTEGKTVYMLGFDHSSGLYREAPSPQTNEQRFFDDASNPLAWMQQQTKFLAEIAKNRGLTQQAVDALAAAKVLVPWDVSSVADTAAVTEPLTGLYRISQEALNGLPATVLELLRDCKALELAYAQLLSMPRLKPLQQLHAKRFPQKQTNAGAPATTSTDPLTPNQLEDLLKFDWMK